MLCLDEDIWVPAREIEACQMDMASPTFDGYSFFRQIVDVVDWSLQGLSFFVAEGMEY